jgi:hypothetical protein
MDGAPNPQPRTAHRERRSMPWLAYVLWPIVGLSGVVLLLTHVFRWNAVHVDATALGLIAILALVPVLPWLIGAGWDRPSTSARLGEALTLLDSSLRAFHSRELEPPESDEPAERLAFRLTRQGMLAPRVAADLHWALYTLSAGVGGDPLTARDAAEAERVARRVARVLRRRGGGRPDAGANATS